MDSAKMGACHELEACSYLLRMGYEVFRNVAASGKIDIIAKKGTRILFIDVATGVIRKDKFGQVKRYPNNQKIKNSPPEVIVMTIYHDGEIAFSKPIQDRGEVLI